jgi:hypothetical protein
MPTKEKRSSLNIRSRMARLLRSNKRMTRMSRLMMLSYKRSSLLSISTAAIVTIRSHLFISPSSQVLFGFTTTRQSWPACMVFVFKILSSISSSTSSLFPSKGLSILCSRTCRNGIMVSPLTITLTLWLSSLRKERSSGRAMKIRRTIRLRAH